MANSSSLIVLVGKTEFSEYSPKKIVLWGKIDKSNESVLCSSFPFINKIEFVKLNKKYLIVNEGTYTHVYNSKTMKNLATLNFGFLKNYCLSLTSLDNTNSYFVYSTYEDLGCVYVYNLTTFSYNNEFQAHKSHIQALQLNYLNNMIATCSEKGTLIRIFSIPDGLKLFTLKRGVNSSIIYSMNFGIKQPNQLIVYSSSGTIHIFKLELNELVEMEIKELLAKYEYDPTKTAFIRGSALCMINGERPDLGRDSIKKLLDAMDTSIPEPDRDVDKPFLLSIDNAINIEGRGCVVTGTIESGKVKIGDDAEIVGYRRKITPTVITGIEMFRKQMDFGQAGDNCGLLLRGIDREDVKRGMYLTKPGLRTVHRNCKADIYVLKEEEGGRRVPFFSKYKPQCYNRTSDCAATITLPEGVEMAKGGDNTKISMKFEFPMPIAKGERFAFREGGKTIAAGVITDILPDTEADIKEEEMRMAKKKKGSK